MKSPEFLPGMVLAERFFHEAVEPLIVQAFPRLRFSAGLIGSGSEVLGFDTPQSSDHHWGPRVMVFVSEDDLGLREDLVAHLGRTLPRQFLGWSTHWGPPDAVGVRLLEPAPEGPLAHRVEVMVLERYLEDYLGPGASPTEAQWLTFSHQKLRTLRAGRLFRDEIGAQAVLNLFAWFPLGVWKESMARLWDQIAEEEPFIGRCLDVGDDLGSRLVVGRLVDRALHLAFLQNRDYPPYSKWFGTALKRWDLSGLWSALADQALNSSSSDREEAFHRLVEALARGHNALGLTPRLPEHVSPFWGRPYRVIHGDRFAAALRASGA